MTLINLIQTPSLNASNQPVGESRVSLNDIRYVKNTQRKIEHVPFRRYIKEKRKTQLQDFFYLHKYEFDIGMIDNNPIIFKQVMKNSNSQKWIDAMN
jgi:type III secretory pathway component EscR